ncbi:MAG: tetratricopeptide repeat protein, partial [Armatimonadota bacterium]
CLLFVTLGLASTSMTEMARANAVEGIRSGKEDEITAAAQNLAQSAPDDAEALYLRGMFASRSPEERIELLQRSAAVAPTTKTLRAIALTQSREKKFDEAVATLDRALQLDPVNLRTLASKMRIQAEAGHIDQATQTAKALVNVESHPAFKTRAIPEVIPVETYEARIFLAGQEQDPKAKVKLLQEAVKGYLTYADVTYPRVKQMAAAGSDFSEVSLDDAKAVMSDGKEASLALKEAAQLVGDADALSTSTRGLEVFSVE